MPKSRLSARDKLRAYFEKNVGQVLKTRDLREVAGINDYQRRIRELRNLEGMKILTHNDRADLRPGEYLLETLDRSAVFTGAISARRRTEILERNGFTCRRCGSGPGDPDPLYPLRKVRLQVDHIVPASQGGTDDPDNLQVLCSACNAGRSNIQAPTESALNLIARIRRAPRAVQREVYELLIRTFDSYE